MAEELGLLTLDQEKQFGDFIDNLIDFRKFDGWVWNIVEVLDGKLFTTAISYLDNTLGNKLPADIKPLAALFVLDIIAEEFDPDAVVESGTNLLNEIIDIPNITEEYEAIMIGGILQVLISAVLGAIAKDEIPE